jgi:hypothetical protein
VTSGAVSDVAGRMANIADLVTHSAASAVEIAAIADDMQHHSQSLRVDLPDIVRKATRADMRECPRYDVDFTARIEVGGRSLVVRVHDISESGFRIEKLPQFAVGTQIAATLAGLRPVSGKVVRAHQDTVGVCFEPQRLRTEEVRRLVADQAA